MKKKAERLMRLALAFVLAFSVCMPSAALAVGDGSGANSADGLLAASSEYLSAGDAGLQAGDSSVSGTSMASKAEAIASSVRSSMSAIAGSVSAFQRSLVSSASASGIDLNAQWTDLENAYNITEGGTYYLSADLEAKSSLTVNAPDADVVVKLNGHTLTLNGSGAATQKTMLSIVAAKSVTLDGSSSKGESAIKSAGELDVWAVSSTADACELSANDLTIELSSKSTQQRYLSTHAVRVAGGALSLTDCNVRMLMGNQSLSSSDLVNGVIEAPSAVYATDAVQKVELVDCSVVGEGTQGFTCELADTITLGNAYALYSLAASTVVKGGSYEATSLRGNATCLYGSALTVERGIDGSAPALEAHAGQLATGVLSTEAGSVTLDAPVSFMVGSDYDGYAQAEAALRTSADNGFVFADCAPDEGSVPYTVLVMREGDGLDAANAEGYTLGLVDSEDPRVTATLFSNALGYGCSPVDRDGVIRFSFGDESQAVAVVVDEFGGEMRYPTLASALDAFRNGTTLRLLMDAGDIVVSTVTHGTLDLNGHSVSSLEYASSGQGAGLAVRNGAVNGVKQVSGSLVAVHQRATAPLSLQGVAVSAQGSDANVYGVYAERSTGEVSLDGASSIDVVVMRTAYNAAGYGIGMPAAGAGAPLALNGCDVRVTTASAGVPVYGVSCTAGLSMNGGSVVARGATATTGALYVGGEALVSGAQLDVHATGTSSSSVGFGVWGRTANPQATSITVSGCSIRVSCDANVEGLTYACLVGSTSNAGSSSTSWTLAGANVFQSTSGMHLGMNLAAVKLASDFELGEGSDPKLVVSQAKQAGHRGFTVEGGPDGDRLEALAKLFEASGGSYYDGWTLVPDGSSASLVWRSGDGGDNSVSLLRGSSVLARYATLSEALADAQTGDSVRLESDLSESGQCSIDVDDFTLDLNGKSLTLRAGGVTSASRGTYDALAFTGAGTLLVKGGSLNVQLGAASEVTRAASVPYNGIVVTNGGMLSVASDAVVNVNYVGSTGATALQRAIVLRGVALANGKLHVAGALNVSGAVGDAALGAMETYGVYVQAGASDAVDVSTSGRVNVEVKTAANTTKNAYHAESTYGATTNDGPTGLRELKVDPETDADLYNAIVSQFRVSATYDDPNDVNNRNALRQGIYYVHDMALEARPDASGTLPWYDGLRIWAFSDVIPTANVGKASAIVPTHIYTSAAYDILPEAFGIATDAAVTSATTLVVNGAVSATCDHGNATALLADGEGGWHCDAATLRATADDEVHPVADGLFDLRDIISFKAEQKERLVFSSAKAARFVKFQSASARGAVIGDKASFVFAGETAFATSSLDAASVEAASFTVDPSFALKDGPSLDGACTVANSAGENAAGVLFAKQAGSAQASLFQDAYRVRASSYSAAKDGVVWGEEEADTVVFQIGDAVVARYANPESIDLSEPTALAKCVGDERQAFKVVGWSLGEDENATSGYIGADQAIAPQGSSVYHAVYETGLLEGMTVTFANVHDAGAQLRDDVVMKARYGQTVGDVIEANADVAMPQPLDYRDESAGITYRFVGWYPYSDSISSAALIYDAEQVKDVQVALSVNGVSATGLVLRAVYVAVQTGKQHVVSFKVDGATSICVVDNGARPTYTQANGTNTNYVHPAKIATETGKTFTFSAWYADDNANGSRDEDEATYPAALPKATADAVYTADWSWEWSDVTLTFYVKYVDKDSGSLVSNGVRVIETTYEKNTQDIADGIAKIGDVFGYGGKTYTLVGWSTRKTDVEPLYDAKNPLPSVNNDDRALSSAYARTFYGVYTVADHKVDVTFYGDDGSTELGKASQVVAVSTSVDKAFAATGAATPADKSQELVFRGWAKSVDAAKALEGGSTMVEDLVGYADTALSLYAVYGEVPTYTVRLRSAGGLQTFYQVPVKRGETVNSVLREKNIDFSIEAPTSKYLAGWYTAGGAYYSLDTPVSGSLNLFAKWGEIDVNTAGDAGLSAAIKLDPSFNASLGVTDEATGLALSLEPRDTSDPLLRSGASKYGYSVLKSYTMKLVAMYASGESVAKDGDVGSIALSLPLDSKYKNAKPRIFWIGWENGVENALYSSVKTISEQGTVSATVGNYSLGDEDEGGNLCVAYIEGGAKEDTTIDDGPGVTDPEVKPSSSSASSSSTAVASSSSSSAHKPSRSSSSSDAQRSSSSSSADDRSSASESSSSSASASTSSSSSSVTQEESSSSSSSVTQEESLSSSSSSSAEKSESSSSSSAAAVGPNDGLSGPTSGGLSASRPTLLSSGGGLSGITPKLSSGNGVSALQKLSSDAAKKAEGLSGLKPTLAGSASSNDAIATGVDGEGVEAEETFGGGASDAWDSDGIVLVVLAALALAAMVYGLWRLFVAKPKRDEEEAELPSIDERYAQGVTF